MVIRKRYGERVPVITILTVCRYTDFEDLRSKLLITFPHAGQALPPLPPKSMLSEPLDCNVKIPCLSNPGSQTDSSQAFWKSEGRVLHTFSSELHPLKSV